jgi:predicted RNase H-like nuclease (RuvC/YqgF family)
MTNETNIQSHIDNRHNEIMNFIRDFKLDTMDWRKVHDLKQDAIIKSQNEQSIAIVKLDEQMKRYDHEQYELKQENLHLFQAIEELRKDLSKIQTKLETMGRYSLKEIIAYVVTSITFITGLYLSWKSSK